MPGVRHARALRWERTEAQPDAVMGQDGPMPSQDFSLHGAIDLGARQAAARKQQERRAQAGGAGPGAAAGRTSWTSPTRRSTPRSWSGRSPSPSSWTSGPSGAVRASSSARSWRSSPPGGGKWILAKVDIDANPQLGAYMQQMGVRGIPFVAAVVGGQLLPFLNGAAPEPQVRQAIEQLFEALRKEGILPDVPEGEQPQGGAADAPAADPVYAEAEDALQRGDIDGAKAAFERILAANPRDGQAKQGLALVELSLRVRSLDAEGALRRPPRSPATSRRRSARPTWRWCPGASTTPSSGCWARCGAARATTATRRASTCCRCSSCCRRTTRASPRPAAASSPPCSDRLPFSAQSFVCPVACLPGRASARSRV